MFYERITFACDGRYIYGWQLTIPSPSAQRYDRVVEHDPPQLPAGRGEDGRCGRAVVSRRVPARAGAALRAEPQRRAASGPCAVGARSATTWRGGSAAGSWCASRTSITVRCRPELIEAGISTISPGSASPGSSRCCASRSISPSIARPRAGSQAMGLLYPCFATRAEIAAAAAPARRRSRRRAALSGSLHGTRRPPRSRGARRAASRSRCASTWRARSTLATASARRGR